MKKFIITIDTEGDNLWNWKYGEPITTENVRFLTRFQNLCDEFGFKPVWLTNYEMITDPTYAEFIVKVEQEKRGELGMHLHAWNTPPKYSLNNAQSGAPYLIEYPVEIMEEKIATMTEKIKAVGVRPVSHRAGRWAMNDRYFRLLIKYGYRVDCSVTPHINWESSAGATPNAKGVDYSGFPESPYWIESGNDKILEVPVTVRKTHRLMFKDKLNLAEFFKAFYRAVKSNFLWLRPNGNNYNNMIKLVDIIRNSNADYIMFMLHSSELMPGGSPTFQTKESIECLYSSIFNLFKYCSKYFGGFTLREYYTEMLHGNNQ